MDITKGPINKVISFSQKYLLISYYVPGTSVPANTLMKQDRQVTVLMNSYSSRKQRIGG